MYTQKNQRKRFREEISDVYEEYIGDDRQFLERGHLTPHADYVMVYEQFATYYFMNVVPQFKTVNNGNWLKIETLARKMAAKLKDDLIVYTSHSYNKPATFTKQRINVPLDERNKNIIIPEKLYKILYHPKTKSGIVFVVYNNPYKTRLERNEHPPSCTNVCNQANLSNIEELQDPTHGYVMCCKLKYIQDNDIDVYREISHAGHTFQKILTMPKG